jgi:hypothetical protein
MEVFLRNAEISRKLKHHWERQASWRNAIFLVNYDPLFQFNSARKRREKSDAEIGVCNTLYRLLQTLYVNHDMQATDSRDKVMGILGLATDALHLGIEGLDYQTPVELVYTRVAKAIISNGGVGLLNWRRAKSLNPSQVIPKARVTKVASLKHP